jgi:hypothetical protein
VKFESIAAIIDQRMNRLGNNSRQRDKNGISIEFCGWRVTRMRNILKYEVKGKCDGKRSSMAMVARNWELELDGNLRNGIMKAFLSINL